jgi:hypothetical protein
MSIARTILQQITALVTWALTAFGATNLFEIPERKEYMGSLMFTVNGLKHKRNVLIYLKWSDEFKIVFMSKDGIPVKECDSVYCDMLVDVLNYIAHGDKMSHF